MEKGIRILAKPPAGAEAVLSPEALAFVEKLHRQFQPTRQTLLAQRAKRQAEFDRVPHLAPLPVPGVERGQ